jgi:hypothetical protein
LILKSFSNAGHTFLLRGLAPPAGLTADALLRETIDMRVTRIGAVGLAAAAMLAGGAGLAAASAVPSTSTVKGTEHFSLMTTQPSASRYVVIANGLFTAAGVDIAGSTTDTVKLPTGTFSVHHGLGHVVRQSLNPLTCLASFVAKANLTINNGTGQFKGISGYGSAVITSLSVLTRNSRHQCDQNKNPQALEQTISANAHIRI